MAMKCDKCGGVIPDICLKGDRSDCKNHERPEINIPLKKSW